MSITFKPKRPITTARTAFSYDHGGFDANVWAQHLLGRAHSLLGLRVAKVGGVEDHEYPLAPFSATAAECRAWAKRIDLALRTFAEGRDDGTTTGAENTSQHERAYLRAWVQFLSTCSGYTVPS